MAKRLERQPISIPQVMHREDLTFSDDRIGIVAPIYGHEVPAMVREFLEKATFQTPYFYMILTYGNRHGGAAELAQELCARYFTYRQGQETYFVLYDDPSTVSSKLNRARRMGLGAAFVLYRDFGPLCRTFLPPSPDASL